MKTSSQDFCYLQGFLDIKYKGCLYVETKEMAHQSFFGCNGSKKEVTVWDYCGIFTFWMEHLHKIFCIEKLYLKERQK
jgi:hypothetical protein